MKAVAVSRLRTLPQDALAGCITAVVFYPEYLGLAGVLATVLPGAQATAIATMSVLGCAIVCCTLSVFTSTPMLSGPRAASLAVMVGAVKFATAYSALESRMACAFLAIGILLLVAGAFQLLGLNRTMQSFVRESNVSLRKGFMYASAIGIVAGVGVNQIDGCLRMDALDTIFVVVASVGLALWWGHHWNRESTASYPDSHWCRKLAPFATLVGVATSAGGYQVLIAASAHSGLCATLGKSGLQLAGMAHLARAPGAITQAWIGAPLWVWAAIAMGGVLLGAVMLFESLTALADMSNTSGVAGNDWAGHLKVNVAANILGAALGLACGSFSTSRSRALRDSFGMSPSAVVFHGVTLLGILFGLNEWLAKLPTLSVAVALLLVAIQMIDKELRGSVWRKGYAAAASPQDVHTTWRFWAVLGFSIGLGIVTRANGAGLSIGVVLGVAACAVLLQLSRFSSTARTAERRDA